MRLLICPAIDSEAFAQPVRNAVKFLTACAGRSTTVNAFVDDSHRHHGLDLPNCQDGAHSVA